MKFSNPFKKSSGSNDNFSQSVTSFNYSPGSPGNSSQSYSSSNTGVSSSSSSSTASTPGVQQVNTYTSNQSTVAPANDSVFQGSQDSIATPVTSDTYSYEGFPVASPNTESQIATSYNSSIDNAGVSSHSSVTSASTPAVTNNTVITETGADGAPGATTSTNVNTTSVSPSPMIIDDSSESFVNGSGTTQVGVTNTDSGGQSAESGSVVSAAAPTNLTQDQIQAIVLNSIETVGSRFDNIPPEYISQLTDSINSSIQNMGNIELASAGTDAVGPDLSNANVSTQNDQTANDSSESQTVTSFNSDPGDSGNSSHSFSSSDSSGSTSNSSTFTDNPDAQNASDSTQNPATTNNDVTQDGQDLTAAVDNSDAASYEDTQSSTDDSQSTVGDGGGTDNTQVGDSGSTYEDTNTSYEGFPVTGDDSQAAVWDDSGSTPGDGSTGSFENTDPSYEGFPESSTYPPADNYDAQAANSDYPENWGSTADVPPDPMNNVMPAADDSQSSYDAQAANSDHPENWH